MSKKTLLLTLSFTALCACASTPEPAPAPEPVAERAPAPQPVAPRPVPAVPVRPVTQDNLNGVTSREIVTGLPVAGSVEDFHYYTGASGRVYFSYDQYDLSSDARDFIRKQADWLARYPGTTAVIEGNADERGTREYNLALGARRAESVKSFMVSLGIAPNRLTTVSYGKERPIDGRSSEAGWSRNRNAHTNLMSGTIG